MVLTLALSMLWLTGPTPTPAPAPVLSATIGKVSCPSRQVSVTVVNDTGQGAGYTLRTNGVFVREEFVPGDKVIKGTAQLKEDLPTVVSVVSAGRTIASAERTANCGKRASAPAVPGDPGGPADPGDPADPAVPKLPHTGGGAEAFARTATGLAVVATGGLLIFWGRLWPSTGRGDWSTPIRRSSP